MGKPAGKILKIFVMYQVGTCMVHCPFPCDVLVMYQPGTLVLAPSGSGQPIVLHLTLYSIPLHGAQSLLELGETMGDG